MTKNIFIYIGIILLSIVLRVVALIVYPVAFLFREKIRTFAGKRFTETPDRVFQMNKGYKKWKLYFHPYFWLWCFTTNSDDFDGPEWYLRDKKLDWLFDLIDAGVLNNDIWFDIVYKLRYFYVCYRWNALRNPHWAFSEWFFREGKWTETTQEVIYSTMSVPYWDIMPEAYFKDAEGNFMSSSGPYIRYPFEASQEWESTHEGKKLITFYTFRGHKRFYYGFCKIILLKRLQKFLVIEQLFGWNWWNGIPVLHNKFMFKKADDLALKDYQKYLTTQSI